MIDLLRARYPQVTVVPWHDAPKVLTEEYNGHTGAQKEADVVTEENWPTYVVSDLLSNSKFVVETSMVQSADISTPPRSATSEDEDVW